MENGTAAAPKKAKLTRLKIESFRNVEPCELRFGDGFNVLLGLNATGKTTLLELIAAVLSGDFSKFRDAAFTVEYELSFSVGTFVVSMRNNRVERSVPEMPALQGRDTERFSLSARVVLREFSPPQTRTACADMSSVWLEETPDVKHPLGGPLGQRESNLLFRVIDIAANQVRFGAWFEDLWPLDSARRFDEALDMFRDITSPAMRIEARVNRNHEGSSASLVSLRRSFWSSSTFNWRTCPPAAKG